ncbi:hypothetical protein POTOM_005857 [Populus tomentosa]|uniref:Fe2OG dioxygenase domain-containing protein n=1 Tax=Populus tomentosa TaxID=118781 RepID=A0A8X8AHV7_POPTO|nr:hypothetical protein POTOM_005857 [Populus tomentosa]
MLAVAEVDHDAMPHGDTGEAFIESIPFQEGFELCDSELVRGSCYAVWFQVLSWKPRALYFPNFATPEQCESIIKMAKSKLKPSTLALRKGETTESTKGTRTRQAISLSLLFSVQYTFFFPHNALDQWAFLICLTLKLTATVQAFNILRYEIGQKYDSHYDAFNPDEYGPQPSQRVASFLLYLSSVEEGGETMFPFENGSAVSSGFEYKQCVGLKVKPRQGDGLLFYSLFPNGTIDRVIVPFFPDHNHPMIISLKVVFIACSKVSGLGVQCRANILSLPPSLDNLHLVFFSLVHLTATELLVSVVTLVYACVFCHKLLQTSLHGSCPVIKGEKWVATKWIRDQMELD